MNFDSKLASLMDEVDKLGKTRDDAWQIPREEGLLLHQIALSIAAKTIVEVGTSYGFSGLFWAAALKHTGGKLHTIDMDPRKAEASRANFDRAGVGGLIVNHLGDAHAILKTIAGPIDLAFIDADKVSTQAYFDLLWPKIRPGGLVLTDNATTHRKDLADFVAQVRSRPDAFSTEVAVGNGIEWTVKTAGK